MTKHDLVYLEAKELIPASSIEAIFDGRGKIASVGNVDLIRQEKLALFCSSKCPGRLLRQTYDLMQKLRRSEKSIVGGSDTPMEKECLTTILLRAQYR